MKNECKNNEDNQNNTNGTHYVTVLVLSYSTDYSVEYICLHNEYINLIVQGLSFKKSYKKRNVYIQQVFSSHVYV